MSPPPFTIYDPEWAQAVTNALAALATFLAVVAAFVIPSRERRRVGKQFRFAFMACVEAILGLRMELETKLLALDPKERLALLRERRAILEHYASREESPDVASVAALLMLRPEMEATEGSLDAWVQHLHSRTGFDIDAFRKEMDGRAQRVGELAGRVRKAGLPS